MNTQWEAKSSSKFFSELLLQFHSSVNPEMLLLCASLSSYLDNNKEACMWFESPLKAVKDQILFQDIYYSEGYNNSSLFQPFCESFC